MPSAYRRVLLKISGDAFSHEGDAGIDTEEVRSVAVQAKGVADLGCELAIVVGGGNIVRGAQMEGKGIRRATADYMGMLATLINGLALQDTLESLGVETRVLTAVTMEQVAEPFIRRRCTRHLEKRRCVILAGGTGNPYFTTDTTAALRAVEIGAEILLKATRVDGVYSSDPEKDPSAERYKRLTYLDVLNRQLGVMDYTAISLCMVHRLPILVFNLKGKKAFERAVRGEDIGTLIVPE